MDAAMKRGTLLFVDDERRVLTSMRAMFRREYEVLLANSGQEALDLLNDHEVDVIVSDQRMPGMTGVEVLKAVKQRAPNAMRILLTGYADLKAIEASINEGEVFRYLTKPCAGEELKEAIGLAAGIATHSDTPSVEVAPLRGVAQPSRQRVDGVETTTIVPTDSTAQPPATRRHPAHANAPVRHAPLTPIMRSPRLSPRMTPGRAGDDDSHIREVELLVLTPDVAMAAALKVAVDGSHRVHHATSLEAAVAALEAHPIGVMVTDTAASAEQVASLTTTLKRHVPELVTIVASSRSDAQLLIDLINYGQIFRFLLKPLHSGQCRLSVESAVVKHRELASDPMLHRRHAVPERKIAQDGMFSAMFGRIRRLRDRFLTHNGLA